MKTKTELLIGDRKALIERLQKKDNVQNVIIKIKMIAFFASILGGIIWISFFSKILSYGNF